MPAIPIPLASSANKWLSRLACATGAAAIAKLDGVTLLGERAMLSGMRIPGRISAGGGCRLYDAAGDTIALNLARSDDRDLLPALFETDDLDPNDETAITARIARSEAAALVARGRMMGLAIASEQEHLPSPLRPGAKLSGGAPAQLIGRRRPRVVDLSALWAGPLAAHLLWLAGADVVKVESRKRPDRMREGEPDFYALLNQGKASLSLDFTDAEDRRKLLSLIASADIVIEAARPRALFQLGIDAAEIVRSTPGLSWVTITAHGADGDAANWVGFGDDCGIAGGLSAALREATGRTGFVGDAIADPLTGLYTALMAWESYTSRKGGRFGFAMSHIVAKALAEAREDDEAGLENSLRLWAHAEGQAFPIVKQRPIGRVAVSGADTSGFITPVDPC